MILEAEQPGMVCVLEGVDEANGAAGKELYRQFRAALAHWNEGQAFFASSAADDEPIHCVPFDIVGTIRVRIGGAKPLSVLQYDLDEGT